MSVEDSNPSTPATEALPDHVDAPATAASSAEPQVDTTTPSLEEQLKQAQLAAEEHHDAWLRAKAEMDNVRKRAQLDVANAHKFAVEKFSAELLAVKDSLEAALKPENTGTVEAMKNGVDLTLKQLANVFEKFAVAEVDPAGARFDPHRHQAIAMVEAEAEPNTVVTVLQKGYLLHDRVLRPALVTVSKPKET